MGCTPTKAKDVPEDKGTESIAVGHMQSQVARALHALESEDAALAKTILQNLLPQTDEEVQVSGPEEQSDAGIEENTQANDQHQEANTTLMDALGTSDAVPLPQDGVGKPGCISFVDVLEHTKERSRGEGTLFSRGSIALVQVPTFERANMWASFSCLFLYLSVQPVVQQHVYSTNCCHAEGPIRCKRFKAGATG